jgi:hypothetical protein
VTKKAITPRRDLPRDQNGISAIDDRTGKSHAFILNSGASAMADPFTASVQYDDLKGYVAIDGYDGPPLHELVKYCAMPGGYFPVGFSLFRFDPCEDGKLPFCIVAVRCDVVGTTMGEIVNYAREHDELPVYSFDGMIDPTCFPALFKRVDVKVLDKNLTDFKVMKYSLP